MKYKLSIIVPVYNVEQYLRKCVDSLLAQDIPASDYEIILVDDGSPDECPQICDSYADIYDNIRIMHRENGGLSAARNTGIKAAKGEYVCFMDSDDYWESNVLGGLMKQVEIDHLDVLRFNYQNVRLKSERIRELENEGEYEIFHPNKDPKRDVDYSESVTEGEIFLNERLGPACYAVMFIIRRELLNDCLFKEGIYFEDTEWTPRMLLRAKRVASTPTVVYNYLWRSGSITLPTDSVKRKKVLDDKIKLLHGFQEQSRLVNNSKWFTWMTSFNSMSILGMLVSLPSNERREYIQELKSLRVFPLSTIRTNRNERIKIWIANISPNIYCHLMNIRK